MLETKTNRDTDEEWLYQYDVLGNLLSVGLPDGRLIEYLVDGLGRAYVTGNTDSTDFPTRNALQRRAGSRDCPTDLPCPTDAFLTKPIEPGTLLDCVGSYS